MQPNKRLYIFQSQKYIIFFSYSICSISPRNSIGLTVVVD